jgi:hypothetical protein
MQRLCAEDVVSAATQEAKMNRFRLAMIAAALLGGTAIAVAQGTAPSGAPMQPNAAGESQEPNVKPGGGGQGSPTRPSASQSDQAVPPHASETHPGNNNSASSVDGASEQPPGATAQTMPSTIDPANAREDKRIIMEHALDLNDEQRQKIAQMLANASGPSTSGAAPDTGGDLVVGNTVPVGVSMHEFPQPMVEQMPGLGKYKYVQLPGKVLVIEPNNRIVIADIKA